MKRSLSTRLMYSYMGLIAVIIVGVSVGLSYLITDYFFKEHFTHASISDNRNLSFNNSSSSFGISKQISKPVKVLALD